MDLFEEGRTENQFAVVVGDGGAQSRLSYGI